MTSQGMFSFAYRIHHQNRLNIHIKLVELLGASRIVLQSKKGMAVGKFAAHTLTQIPTGLGKRYVFKPNYFTDWNPFYNGFQKSLQKHQKSTYAQNIKSIFITLSKLFTFAFFSYGSRSNIKQIQMVVSEFSKVQLWACDPRTQWQSKRLKKNMQHCLK